MGGEFIRICLVTEIFHPEDQGGQGQQAFALATRLRGRGIAVTVLTRRNFEASALRETLAGIAVERLPPVGLLKGAGWKALWPTLRFIGGLFVRLIRQRRSYDLILVQGVKAILLPTLLAGWILRRPCIVKIDALAELEQDLTPESLARMGLRERSIVVRAWARLRDLLLRRARALVAISSELASSLAARGLPAAQVVQIPNGIDLQRWTHASCSKSELRSRLSLPDGILVTYAGRLSRAKGLLRLMRAWEEIVRRRPRAHLVIVGGGERSFDSCEDQLRELVRTARLESHVTFTGHVDNVPDYLRASDLFVVCSESEGFGLSLVEAMASGLPCISTAVGAAPEIIRDRANGWLIAVNDDKALLAALEDALSDPLRWPAMGAAGQREVTSRFCMEQVATRYTELFNLVLPRTAGAARKGAE